MQKIRNLFEAQLWYNKLKNGEQLNPHDQQIAIEFGQKLEEKRRTAQERRTQRNTKGQSMGR